MKQAVPFILTLFSLSLGCATSRPVVTQTLDFERLDQKVQNDWKGMVVTSSSAHHFALGEAHSLEGETDAAIEEYRAALIYDAKSDLILNKLAAEYAKKGLFSLAIETAQKALVVHPKSVDAHLTLGGIYSASQASDLAANHFEKALKIEPTNEEAAVFYIQALLETGRTAEAVKVARRSAQLIPDSSAIFYILALTEQLAENFDGAISAYKKSLDLVPGFAKAALAMGLLLESQGKAEAAIGVYTSAFEAKSDSQLGGRLAQVYIQRADFVKAIKVYEALHQVEPNDSEHSFKLGLLYMQQNHWDRAVKALSESLVSAPDQDRVHYYLSAAFEEQKQLTAAADHLKSISPESKYFEDAAVRLVTLLKSQKREAEAVDYLNGVLEKNPENVNLHIQLAAIYEARKEFPEASKAIDRGLKTFPLDEKLTYSKGAILEQQGDTKGALVWMEKVVEINPKNAEALNFIGYSWTTQGVRLKDAEDLLRRAVALRPDNAFFLDSLGWNLFISGRSEEALPVLEKAVALKSDEGVILKHLAEVYIRVRLPNRALAIEEQVRKLSAERSPASE